MCFAFPNTTTLEIEMFDNNFVETTLKVPIQKLMIADVLKD